MSVTAVVVAASEDYLHDTLVALKEQELQPERIILVDARLADIEGTLQYAPQAAGISTPIEVIEARSATNFGRAIAAALAQTEVETEWLWLLHDDSPPMPAALSEQVRATAYARSVGIAGAKQVDFDDPDRLLSVGVTYTRAGRRLPEIEPGEIDQGQYDAREDVFAVGTAGMLIRTATWTAMGGTDPTLGPFLDGAELSRRVRLAGERVIVVPTAMVRHARASLWHGPDRSHADADGAHSFTARRTAVLHYRLVTANLLFLPFVALSMFIAGVLRGLRRLAGNDLRAAWLELTAPMLAIAGGGGIYRARRKLARTSTAGRGALRPLQASRLELAHGWWSRWRAARASRRHKIAPSELEITERRVITRRRRLMLAVLGLGLLGVSAAAIIRIFAGGGSLTSPLTGGALGGVDQNYRELWERVFSGWAALGDGAPMPEHPFAIVLASLATLVGGPVGVPASAVAGLLLGFAVPLAGLSAWFGAGGLTRSVTLRAWIAAAWALLPVLSQALVQGRLAAIVAHILLPLFALAATRAFGVDRRDVIRPGLEGADGVQLARTVPALSRASGIPSLGAAAAAGLIAAAISASAPILAPVLLLIVVISGIVARRGFLQVLLMAAPGVVLFVPHVAYGVSHGWERIFESVEHAPINMTLFVGPEAPWWQQLPWHGLVGWVGVAQGTAVSAAVAIILGLLATVGLFSSEYSGVAARWGWLVAAMGLGVATGAGFILGAPQYDWLGSFQRLPQWAGPGVSLASAGMIIAAAAGMLRIVSLYRQKSSLIWKVTAGLGVAGLAGTLVAGAVIAVNESVGEPQWGVRTAQPLPALARQTVSGPERSRVLMLAPSELTIAAEIWRANGPQLLDQPLALPEEDPARADLRSLAAEIYAGEAADLGSRLAAHGVGFVLVPNVASSLVAIDELSREELVASLDAIGLLERVTQNDSGTLWRVVGASGRATIVQAAGRTTVPSAMIEVDAEVPELASAEAGTLVLAERADPRWRATLNNRPLRSVNAGWQQAFELPAEASGDLRVDFYPFTHRLWRIGFVAVLVFTGVLAIPLRRRPEVVQ